MRLTDSLRGISIYGFDLRDRLVSANIGGSVSAYDYLPNGLRRSKTVNGHVTIFGYSADKVELEINEDRTIRASYTYGTRLIKSATAYYVFNGYLDVVQLTNMSGAVTRDYSYDPYGNQLSGSDKEDTNPFRYNGEYWDSHSGLIYLRARFYDPEIGRFINLDPIRDGLNWYVYAGNNPIMFFDPMGLSAQYIVWSGPLSALQGDYSKGMGGFYTATGCSESGWNITGSAFWNGSFWSSWDSGDSNSWYSAASGNTLTLSPITGVFSSGLDSAGSFRSLNKAVIDFARRTNSLSIQNDWEFGTYFYSWWEAEEYIHWFWRETRTRMVELFSYTVPHTNRLNNAVSFETENIPIPVGTTLAGLGHTHGAYKDPASFVNDTFSLGDIASNGPAAALRTPLFLSAPNGSVHRYNPTEPIFSNNRFEWNISRPWTTPFDAGHPNVPRRHANSPNAVFR